MLLTNFTGTFKIENKQMFDTLNLVISKDLFAWTTFPFEVIKRSLY